MRRKTGFGKPHFNGVGQSAVSDWTEDEGGAGGSLGVMGWRGKWADEVWRASEVRNKTGDGSKRETKRASSHERRRRRLKGRGSVISDLSITMPSLGAIEGGMASAVRQRDRDIKGTKARSRATRLKTLSHKSRRLERSFFLPSPSPHLSLVKESLPGPQAQARSLQAFVDNGEKRLRCVANQEPLSPANLQNSSLRPT